MAVEVHGGQPYHNSQFSIVEHHLRPIAFTIRMLGGSSIRIASGWLHDVKEDTGATDDDLVGWGMPPGVVSNVSRLSKQPDQAHEEYMWSVAENPETCDIKGIDSTWNLIAALALKNVWTPEEFEVSVLKYAWNINFLNGRHRDRRDPRWARFLALQADRARAIVGEHFGQAAVSLATGLSMPAVAS